MKNATAGATGPIASRSEPGADSRRVLAVAEAVREACRQAVTDAWEDAGIQGLCVEGRCEVAIGALERLDLAAIVEAELGAAPRRASGGSMPQSGTGR